MSLKKKTDLTTWGHQGNCGRQQQVEVGNPVGTKPVSIAKTSSTFYVMDQQHTSFITMMFSDFVSKEWQVPGIRQGWLWGEKDALRGLKN